MNKNTPSPSELKKKLRQLKKLEIRLRFGGNAPERADFVWDSFFDLHEPPAGKGKHTLRELSSMNREQYRAVLDEYFFSVYYRIYRDKGLMHEGLFDPEVLTRIGLPPDADEEAIKRKFRQLALKLHPDVGGDAEKFIELMENYRKLVGKGK